MKPAILLATGLYAQGSKIPLMVACKVAFIFAPEMAASRAGGQATTYPPDGGM
jgi:hypothetical protein